MNGWMGRILKVDLSSSKINEISTSDYSNKYLGGRGVAARIYWENVLPDIKAFDSENYLIFMTGPLVATGAQGATRMAVAGKSPMTFPEQYCYGNMGGFFPAELKKAGYDGIVVTGRSKNPVCIFIQDNQVRLYDASTMWGLGCYETAEIIEKEYGSKARFLTMGIAGERLVRSAVIFGSHQSTSTAGFGAVMASKNLKAIVVKGKGRPSLADPGKLKELNRYIIKICKRLDMSIPPDLTMIGYGHIIEAIGKDNCYQCGLDCNRNRYRYGNRPDLVATRRCQAMEYYLPWKYTKEEEPVDTFYKAPVLANHYGICTFELRNIINWLYTCKKFEALSTEETGLPMDRIGTYQFLEKLLHSIAYREGFGDVLAEGLVRAVEKVPKRAGELLDSVVQPVGELDVKMPRLSIVHALLDPMEPRMSRPIAHAGFARAALMYNKMDPGSNPVTDEVLRKIAKLFWGSYEAADPASYDGKALAAVKIQNRNIMEDSLGLCDFGWPLAYSFSKPDVAGEPDLEENLFVAVTGESGKRIDKCLERIFLMQRAIQAREGRKIPEDDFPAEINFTEALQPVSALEDESFDKTNSTKGKILDRKKYKKMLAEYYSLRGLDPDTGLPLKKTLTDLELVDL